MGDIYKQKVQVPVEVCMESNQSMKGWAGLYHEMAVVGKTFTKEVDVASILSF